MATAATKEKGQARKGAQRPMSQEHKDALAAGRKHRLAINRYLTLVQQTKPRRGRKRSMETVQRRLEQIQAELVDAEPYDEVVLRAEQDRLEVELARSETAVDLSAAEAEFVEVVKPFSEKHGISFQTWKEVGAPIDVLKKAGLTK